MWIFLVSFQLVILLNKHITNQIFQGGILMMKKYTVLISGIVLFLALSLFGQTMTYKTGYQFPALNASSTQMDSILNGLSSIRGMDYNANPLGDNVPAFAVTNYHGNGFIHVFKMAGNDSMELVWTSPAFDSLGGSSRPRFVKWADLDGDGRIELLAPFNQNGIAIFEWDGVPGSWNFGDKPAQIIGDPLYAMSPDSGVTYCSVEFLDVGDFDGDNRQELAFANNSNGSDFDRYYIFSIEGDFSTGDPGFSSVKREAMFRKNAGDYASYGGGTPYAVIGADLNGDGQKEMIFHNWNYGHVTPVRSTGADTYALADTAHKYVYGNYPDDCVSLGGGTAFDVNGDGTEEVFIPLYSANGLVEMVHYGKDSSVAKIDSNNVYMIDMRPGEDKRFDFFGRAGYGDWDQDGKPNIYVAGRHGDYVMTAEFQGGDLTDSTQWEISTLYDGLGLDSTIYSAIEITDSAGVVDSVFTLQANSEGTIAMKLYGAYTDFDRDSYEDILIPTQAWKDSIDITKHVWLKDTSYVVYDTLFAGTDSMTIDTVNITEPVYETTAYKEVEPHRISFRMIESSIINGIEAKDVTVISPNDYKLKQNYPNPFNPTTTIEFYLPVKKRISLTVYNALGQKIKTLVDNQTLSRGSHIAQWNATNAAGKKVASGMYIYELKYGNFTQHKRMMLLK